MYFYQVISLYNYTSHNIEVNQLINHIKTRKRYHRYNILIIIVIPKKDIILGMIEKIKITNLNININNNTNNKWIKIRKDVYKDREIPEDILIITTNKWSP